MNLNINQGDVYWIEFEGDPVGSEPAYRHPHVVVQSNIFNKSRIQTTVVCPLSSVTKRADAPGNVSLEKGEAFLGKASVVLVSQLITIDKTQLEEYIGTVSPKKVAEIIEGIKLVLEPRDPE